MITSKNGVLCDGNVVLSAFDADMHALHAGFHHAEQLVVWLAGRQGWDSVLTNRVSAEADGTLETGDRANTGYVYWKPTIWPGDGPTDKGSVTLDGDFSIDVLRAIAWWMKNYNEKAEAWYRAQKQA